MLAFAYSECGLSVDDFFNLSWYEWSLELYKAKVKKKNEWELNASLTREVIAAIYNTAGKTYKKQFESKEFIPLSFDKDNVREPKETREMTPEEIEEKFSKHLKG